MSAMRIINSQGSADFDNETDDLQSPAKESGKKYKKKHNKENSKQNNEQRKKQSTSSVIDVPVLRRAAMDYLARREHSFFELQQKLRTKIPDVDNTMLTVVLEQLRQENLQSDARFVECYVRYRKSRGFAYNHIKSDLGGRGVSDSLISANLFEDDDDWAKIASRLIDKRLTNGEPLEFGGKAHRKLMRFLESRGFPNYVVRKLLSPRLV